MCEAEVLGAAAAREDVLTAGALYDACLTAAPPSPGWFTVDDVSRRLFRALLLFYRLLLSEPRALLSFTWAWNLLWYGNIIGVLFTLCLPIMPMVLLAIALVRDIRLLPQKAAHLPPFTT